MERSVVQWEDRQSRSVTVVIWLGIQRERNLNVKMSCLSCIAPYKQGLTVRKRTTTKSGNIRKKY